MHGSTFQDFVSNGEMDQVRAAPSRMPRYFDQKSVLQRGENL